MRSRRRHSKCLKSSQAYSLEEGDKLAPAKNKHVLVLLSGGIDSTACTAFYLTQRFSVCALFFDYGQPSARRESDAASAICRHYGIPLEKIVCSGFGQWSGSYIPGRNAFLLHAALMVFKHTTGIIAIGVHSGTPYYDCSEQFIRHMQSSFDLYTDGRVSIGAPFVQWNKRDIWDYCRSKEVPIQLTYSCELGREQPCGQCLSCKDLEALHAC